MLCSYDGHRAAPPVLSMRPNKRKLDEEKSQHASLAEQNAFGPTFSHRMLRLVKGTAEPNTCCQMARGGLLSVVPHLFAVPVLVLWVGLEKIVDD